MVGLPRFSGELPTRLRQMGLCLWQARRVAPAALAMLVCGCQTLPPPNSPPPGYLMTHEQTSSMPLEKDIGGVAAFYDPYNPWVWNDERSKIRGLVVSALYLVGPDSRGVFADGIIKPRMYVLEDVQGKETPKLVKEWSFDPEQLMDWRSRKRTAMGWGYMLVLVWGDDLDLRGKQIRMTISFERTDGRVVHSAKKDFRVPP